MLEMQCRWHPEGTACLAATKWVVLGQRIPFLSGKWDRPCVIHAGEPQVSGEQDGRGESKSLLGAFWAEAPDGGGPGAMLSPKAMHMVLSKLALRAHGTSPGHVTVAWTGGRGEGPGSTAWGSRIRCHLVSRPGP